MRLCDPSHGRVLVHGGDPLGRHRTSTSCPVPDAGHFRVQEGKVRWSILMLLGSGTLGFDCCSRCLWSPLQEAFGASDEHPWAPHLQICYCQHLLVFQTQGRANPC